MENKSIPMTDFVLKSMRDQKYRRDKYDDLCDYARFLKQPLTLGMFTPCDENGNVMSEPAADNYSFYTHKNQSVKEEHEGAKGRVLFKDCQVKEIKSDKNYFVVYHKSRQIWISWTDRIIEDFILNRNFLNGLELTDYALKQIGLKTK
jgi:hypothetical protein